MSADDPMPLTPQGASAVKVNLLDQALPCHAQPCPALLYDHQISWWKEKISLTIRFATVFEPWPAKSELQTDVGC